MDFTAFREAFPALKRTHQGKTLVFMDGPGLDWGISMVHNGPEAYLIQYEVVQD